MRASSLVALGLGLALSVPSLAAAQGTPKVEVSGGYQLLGLKSGIDETLEKGWYADVAGNMGRHFAAVFQVGGNYKTFNESFTVGNVTGSAEANTKVHEFMGGLRVKAPAGSVTPFAQVLVGGVNESAKVKGSVSGPGAGVISSSSSESNTDFGMQVGGGVTFHFSDRLGLRAAGDYLRVFADEDDVNVFRFAVGAVFSF